MSPLSKLQLGQITDDRKGQIKEAAIRVFARYGFAGTKTSMIAAEAGISEGLMYRYFKSKDELFTILVGELMTIGRQETENVQYLPGSPLEQLKTLTLTMLDERSKFAFMLILRSRKDEKIPPSAAKLLGQSFADVMIDQLVPVFIKGQQDGEFIEGNPHQLLSWYFNIVNCLIVEEVAQKEYGLPDIDVLMRMLKK